ncbi:hypothetical protein KCU65_g231, partial [Aureobasidium melanogenum]
MSQNLIRPLLSSDASRLSSPLKAKSLPALPVEIFKQRSCRYLSLSTTRMDLPLEMAKKSALRELILALVLTGLPEVQVVKRITLNLVDAGPENGAVNSGCEDCLDILVGAAGSADLNVEDTLSGGAEDLLVLARILTDHTETAALRHGIDNVVWRSSNESTVDLLEILLQASNVHKRVGTHGSGLVILVDGNGDERSHGEVVNANSVILAVLTRLVSVSAFPTVRNLLGGLDLLFRGRCGAVGLGKCFFNLLVDLLANAAESLGNALVSIGQWLGWARRRRCVFRLGNIALMLGAFSLETGLGRRSSHLLEGVDVGEDGLLCLGRAFKRCCLTGSGAAEETDRRVLDIGRLSGGSRLVDDRLRNSETVAVQGEAEAMGSEQQCSRDRLTLSQPAQVRALQAAEEFLQVGHAGWIVREVLVVKRIEVKRCTGIKQRDATEENKEERECDVVMFTE